MRDLTPTEIQEIVRRERREYAKEWRSKNKDKAKRINEAYWQRRAERRGQESAAQQETEAKTE